MTRPRAPQREDSVAARALRLVGLGVRARVAAVGVERVRDAARRGRLCFAVVAADASHNTLAKLVPLLRARHISFLELPSGAALGAVVGREHAAVIGILDPELARGLRALSRTGGDDRIEEGV